ncbi:MAG: FkbM family methyltransferase [Clostridium sp.]|nr:FkbM family methyltransferase [Clostridium sp.]
MIKKFSYQIYHRLQNDYWPLMIISRMQKWQVTTLLGDVICYPSIVKNRKKPDEGTLKARAFYSENKKLVHEVMDMLADEKSRAVYKNVIEFRTGRGPIKKELYSLWDQYFCRDIIRLQEGEVFIDGGAYVGDTIERLMKEAKRQGVKLRRVVAFEPGNCNYRILKKKFSKADIEVTMIKKGLADTEKTLCFRDRGSSSAFLEKEPFGGGVMAPVINIDSVEECRDATFIKMDIEGAEMDALYGAKETILRNRPKLAICIYHSDEDMVRIARYIHSLVPEYKLYVRHHTRRNHETVLYGVV